MTTAVALIGYGLGGRAFHAPVIASTPGLTLSAIVTGDPERANDARKNYPAARIISRADELFRNPAGVDVVVISTPNRTHVPLALAALESGLHVVVDKPIAIASADAHKLLEDARQRRLMLTVYHNRRFDGDFLTLQRLLREDALGRVHRFESRFERWRPDPKPTWRESSSPDEGGGILLDLGPHLIDQALVLFGPVTDVYAEIANRRGVPADDDVFIALHHESGVESHLWMSALAADAGPRFRLLGNRAAYTKFGMDVQEEALRNGMRPGSVGWGIEPREQWGTLGAGDHSEPVATESGDYRRFYELVSAAIDGHGPPPVDPQDAVTVLEIIEEARRKARL